MLFKIVKLPSSSQRIWLRQMRSPIRDCVSFIYKNFPHFPGKCSEKSPLFMSIFVNGSSGERERGQ